MMVKGSNKAGELGRVKADESEGRRKGSVD
jgi:hypothetical protein